MLIISEQVLHILLCFYSGIIPTGLTMAKRRNYPAVASAKQCAENLVCVCSSKVHLQQTYVSDWSLYYFHQTQSSA